MEICAYRNVLEGQEVYVVGAYIDGKHLDGVYSVVFVHEEKGYFSIQIPLKGMIKSVRYSMETGRSDPYHVLPKGNSYGVVSTIFSLEGSEWEKRYNCNSFIFDYKELEVI